MCKCCLIIMDAMSRSSVVWSSWMHGADQVLFDHHGCMEQLYAVVCHDITSVSTHKCLRDIFASVLYMLICAYIYMHTYFPNLLVYLHTYVFSSLKFQGQTHTNHMCCGWKWRIVWTDVSRNQHTGSAWLSHSGTRQRIHGNVSCLLHFLFLFLIRVSYSRFADQIRNAKKKHE